MFDRISSRRGRVIALALSVAALSAAFSVPASAQQGWDKKTRVTFTAPVEIPGISAQVLPAGTYVFRLLDSLADRHIVQVLNQDESHLYANILAIPNYRLRPTDKTVMTFSERKAGEPQAIRAWFYPGDNTGQEFVYPKSKAVELAKIAKVPVLYIPEEIAPNIVAPIAEVAEAPVAVLKEAPVVALSTAPVRAVTPAGADLALAEVVSPPPVQVARALPKTASPLPLFFAMGFLCLALGLWRRPLCIR